jgi:hypothetical protein
VRGRLDRFVHESGLSNRAQLIQLTRAVLVVEGEHDRLVIDRFFGKDLRQARVRVLPLRGAKNASAIADLELLRDLDVTLFVLFDNVHAGSLDELHDRASDSLEVREIKRMLRDWPDDRARPMVLAYDAPDIVCALPAAAMEAVMRRTNPQATFDGWMEVIGEYQRLHPRDRHKFKDFAAVKTGLSLDSRTIRQVLAHSSNTLTIESPLYRPMQSLLAFVTDGRGRARAS